MKQIQLNLIIPPSLAGQRLDQALAQLLPDYSRSRIQTWIEQQMVTINGSFYKSRDKVFGNEQVAVNATLSDVNEQWVAQAIGLDIIYEDEHILVISKPAGLVVHPAAGNYEGTLLNALLHHLPTLATLPRAGIVHRLDKDTSGLLVIAKSLEAHADLIKQLQARTVKREYEAIVIGELLAGGAINEPIGRHPVDRKRMAVVRTGKPAISHYKILQKFTGFTHVQVNLETGRTHQIRVHMAYIKHPLLGDPVYGKTVKLVKSIPPALSKVITEFNRQALHARRLGLIHPITKQQMEWSAPLPHDMLNLLTELSIISQS